MAFMYWQATPTIHNRFMGMGMVAFCVLFSASVVAGDNEPVEIVNGPRLSAQVIVRPIPPSLADKLREKRSAEQSLPEQLPVIILKLLNDGHENTRFPTRNIGREFTPAMDGNPHRLTLEWNDPSVDTDGYSILRPSTDYAMVDLPYKHAAFVGGDVVEFSLSLYDLVAGYAERAEKLDRPRLADGPIFIRYRVQSKFADLYGTWSGLLEVDSGLCVKNGILDRTETATQG